LAFQEPQSNPALSVTAEVLGGYTMEKFCTDCDGDFHCFIADILKRHLQIEPPA